MTNFRDGELLSMVSSPDREEVEWQAISYALQWAMAEMVRHSFYIRTYSAVDELPEKILDAMAIELRAQYYEDSLPIEMKRRLVKSSLKWYSKAGTPAAVLELVETVFGSGKLTEWFENGADPYTFEIETDTQITPEIVNELERMILKVKNTRSHLSKVSIKRSNSFGIFVGGKTGANPHVRITMGISDGAGGAEDHLERKNELEIFAGFGSHMSKRYVFAEAPQVSYTNELQLSFGAGSAVHKKYKITGGNDGTV